MEKGSFVWVLKDYSVHKEIGVFVGKVIESEEFAAAGHRWTLLFYPYGRTYDAYDDGYTSMDITLRSKTNGDSVRLIHELFLVNQCADNGCNLGVSLYQQKEAVSPSLTCGGDPSGVPRFLKRAEIESPCYLKDDCLKFHCRIVVLTSEIPRRTDFYELLLESEDGADVFFKVGDQTFYAHKGVLAARVPILCGLLRLDSPEPQELVIRNMEPKIFKTMLRFIYKGSFLEEEQEALDVAGPLILNSFLGKMLAAANRFSLSSLKRTCEARIMKYVSLQSVAYVLYLAELHHAVELKDACLKFALENQDDLSRLDGYGYLAVNSPSLLSYMHRAQVVYQLKALFVTVKAYVATMYTLAFKKIKSA